jgi:hypothetical protein
MGLVASVMCSCFADGLTEKPPFADRVRLDQSGFLTLDLPYENNEDKHHLFDKWLATACKHPNMESVSEVISNWSGYRSFQETLEATEQSRFPTFKAELPDGNGGLTDSASASKMLEELTSFMRQDKHGWTTVLIDTDTGEELHEYIAAYDGIFSYGVDGIDMGVDEKGFFVWKRYGERFRELFRSMRFQQRLLDRGLRKLLKRSVAEFVDIETGNKIRCHRGVFRIRRWADGMMQDDQGMLQTDYPARLHVSKRERQASEFKYIVSPLRKLCEASIETGNPIRWH